MHLASHRVLRRASIFGALLALLGLASMSLTQCTMVNDNVTGVSFAAAQANKCLKDCRKDYDSATRAEFKLNQRNRKACDGEAVCLAIEAQRHREALIVLEQSYAACRAECHHQGGGGGQ